MYIIILCLLLSMHVCFVLFPLFDLSFVDFPSVLRYCWLGLFTCKNRLPYNLYCVGGDVKHCTIQSNWQGLQQKIFGELKNIYLCMKLIPTYVVTIPQRHGWMDRRLCH